LIPSDVWKPTDASNTFDSPTDGSMAFGARFSAPTRTRRTTCANHIRPLLHLHGVPSEVERPYFRSALDFERLEKSPIGAVTVLYAESLPARTVWALSRPSADSHRALVSVVGRSMMLISVVVGRREVFETRPR
jgi:hypothetical protein